MKATVIIARTAKELVCVGVGTDSAHPSWFQLCNPTQTLASPTFRHHSIKRPSAQLPVNRLSW